MKEIYTNGEYLDKTKTWHAEDSPWKAEQVAKIVSKNQLTLNTLTEIGCGSGQILAELSKRPFFDSVKIKGFDISPQAIELCEQINSEYLDFYCSDLLDDNNSEIFDVLLALDVFEHVPDYMGFLQKCKDKAEYKIYHIPLEINVSGVLRGRLIPSRQSFGHLHFFSVETALATLHDTGHDVIDYAYTNGAIELFSKHPSIRKAISNIPRWIVSKFSLTWSARLFGGYSLIVLTR